MDTKELSLEEKLIGEIKSVEHRDDIYFLNPESGKVTVASTVEEIVGVVEETIKS